MTAAMGDGPGLWTPPGQVTGIARGGGDGDRLDLIYRPGTGWIVRLDWPCDTGELEEHDMI